MNECKVIDIRGPEVGTRDALTSLLQAGAQRLIREAVEAELSEFLAQYEQERLPDGRARIVRNGYLPEREVQTGIGSIPVSVPRTRDRGGKGIRFASSILPPYLRRSKSVEELLPWLYLKGISTNDFQEALSAILGNDAVGLSASTISRLKSDWEHEQDEWSKRSLASKPYVYIWADGIHCGIRGTDEKMCVLVVLGVTENGTKELVALNDGYRESAEGWLSLLRDLRDRGMVAPALAIGDGALGFWKALGEVFPTTKEQRCWQHKTQNILDKLPESMQERGLKLIRNIWMAASKSEAQRALCDFQDALKDKYPKAVETLMKDTDSLFTFYDFPAAHWRSIRTTNPIESTFSTVRHRASKTKGCVSQATMLALVYKLVQSAQKRWNRIAGFERLADVITGIQFSDGLTKEEHQNNNAISSDQQVAA